MRKSRQKISQPPERPSQSYASTPEAFSIVETLFRRMTRGGESFWSTVVPMFMSRDLTRNELRQIVAKGLQQTGSDESLAQLFNMPSSEYPRFLKFLKRHGCHLPAQQQDKRRAERYRIWIPLRYRRPGEEDWKDAHTENLSRIGVLFRTAKPIDVDTPIEILMAAPPPISSHETENILCHGRVVRTERRDTPEGLAVAAILGDCVPVPQVEAGYFGP